MLGRMAAAAALLAVLLAGWLAVPVVAAAPEQVHVSLHDGGLAVSWARTGDVSATVADEVQWGATPEQLDNRTPQDVVQVTAPGTTLLSASLGPLAGGLAYRVGSDADGWSPVYELRVPQADQPWRMAVYGDHGTGAASEYSAALVPQVLRHAPNVVLHAGDLAYADGDAAIWDDWFRLVEPVAATSLYMAAPGNHEHEGYYPASGPNPEYAPATAAALDPYQQFRSRFRFPGSELSYSFDAGPVHVLVLNSEDLCLAQPVTFYMPWRVTPPCDPGTTDMPLTQETPPNQALVDFARADLQTHRDAPWTFVLLHRPVYTSGAYQGERILQEHYVPLFEEFGVDLVLSGHDHTYQRSYPLQGGEPAHADAHAYPQGVQPIYIVTGGAGEGLYSLDDAQPAWTAVRAMDYHYVLLDVTPNSIVGRAILTTTGEEIDRFTLGEVVMTEPSLPQETPGLSGAMLAAAVACLACLRSTRKT